MQDQAKQAAALSVVQVVAGALAAVSAAIIASAFGLAGTLLGAAVTSVVATVAGALYTRSLERARARIRIRRNPRTGAVEREVVAPPAAPRPVRWGLVAGAAALVFALALGGITALELLARRPVASLRGQPAPAGTTLGAVVQEVQEVVQHAPGVAPEATPTVPAEETPTVVMPGIAPAGTATAETPATVAAPARTPTPTAPAMTQPAAPTPTATPAPHAPVAPTGAPAAPGTAPAGTPGP